MTAGARCSLDPAGSGKLIGSRLDDWLEMSIDDLPEFMRGRPSEERVLRMKDGRAFYGHAIAPQTPQVTAALRRREQVLPGALGSFAGADPDLQRMLKKAARLASTSVPLLLYGETGTGKEKLARAIHMANPKARGFNSVPCGGTSSFGFCREIAPGTLFLVGIEDLTAVAQTSLLAELENRSDLRILASCRCAPSELASILRDDLLHRLVGATLALPPLRHRTDLDWLIDRILRRCSSDDIRLSPVARAELKSRQWTGNIRELEHTLESAVALCEDAIIDLTDLPSPVLSRTSGSSPEEEKDHLEKLLIACDWNMSQAARRLGLNRSTVLRRMRKAGLTPPE
ncbi:MAG: sigma 54-interacting transcriptional regulator [Pseudomonadota bacterium]